MNGADGISIVRMMARAFMSGLNGTVLKGIVTFWPFIEEGFTAKISKNGKIESRILNSLAVDKRA